MAKPNPSTTTVRSMMVSPVFTVKPEMKLWEVAEFFIQKGISGAPVVDKMNRVISVIGDGMVLRLAATEGLYVTVAHCLPKMPKPETVITVGADEPFSEAYKLFLQDRVHRVPVVDDNGKLLGLISRGTILRIFIEAHYGMPIPKRP